MKRQVSFTEGSVAKKSSTSSNKKYPRYKNLNVKFNKAISFCTKAGYFDISIGTGQVLEIGIGCSSQGPIYTVSSATETQNSWAGASEIAALYDAYRIVKMELTITFNQNTGNITSIGQVLPWMYVTKDYNDINTVAGSGLELYQKPSVIQVALGRNSNKSYDYKGSIIPKVATVAYSSVVTSGYLEPKGKQWVNTSAGLVGSFTDVHHYGYKVCIDATAGTTTGSLVGKARFFIKCFFELKNPC